MLHGRNYTQEFVNVVHLYKNEKIEEEKKLDLPRKLI